MRALVVVVCLLTGCSRSDTSPPFGELSALTEAESWEAESGEVPADRTLDEGASPTARDDANALVRWARSECGAPELRGAERQACRVELFARLVAELGEADPAIRSARARGASDAELTPLYERHLRLRHWFVVELAEEDERAEIEDEIVAALDHPVPPATDDETANESAFPAERRRELEARARANDEAVEAAARAEVSR